MSKLDRKTLNFLLDNKITALMVLVGAEDLHVESRQVLEIFINDLMCLYTQLPPTDQQETFYLIAIIMAWSVHQTEELVATLRAELSDFIGREILDIGLDNAAITDLVQQCLASGYLGELWLPQSRTDHRLHFFEQLPADSEEEALVQYRNGHAAYAGLLPLKANLYVQYMLLESSLASQGYLRKFWQQYISDVVWSATLRRFVSNYVTSVRSPASMTGSIIDLFRMPTRRHGLMALVPTVLLLGMLAKQRHQSLICGRNLLSYMPRSSTVFFYGYLGLNFMINLLNARVVRQLDVFLEANPEITEVRDNVIDELESTLRTSRNTELLDRVVARVQEESEEMQIDRRYDAVKDAPTFGTMIEKLKAFRNTSGQNFAALDYSEMLTLRKWSLLQETDVAVLEENIRRIRFR